MLKAALLVAVASNFYSPALKLVDVFRTETGIQVSIAQGASGKLAGQIENGAPFHLLLSADSEIPKRLIEKGKAVAGSQWSYATGRLAYWEPRSAEPAIATPDFPGLPADGKIAIANPKLAPYGAAAITYLERQGILKKVEARLVMGESIAQTFQFVSTGNARAGFVAWSQIRELNSKNRGQYFLIPSEQHSPIRQDGVVLNLGRDLPDLKRFVEFLKSDRAKKIIKETGYDS